MLGTTLYFEVIIIRLHLALHITHYSGYKFSANASIQSLNQNFRSRNLTRNQTVLLTHGDSVNSLGEQLEVMGYTSNRIVAALSCENLKIYGVQFHPEVSSHMSTIYRMAHKFYSPILSFHRLISPPMANKCSLIS